MRRGMTGAPHTFFPWIKPQTLYNLHRPHLLHPFASVIDEPELKAPEEMVRVISGLPTIFFLMMCTKRGSDI